MGQQFSSAQQSAGRVETTRFVYEFSVWPAERGFSEEVYELFRHLRTRVAMEFTEAEFSFFRDSLNNHGFTLREIGRVPYHEPELIL